MIRDFVNDRICECELAEVLVPVHKQKAYFIQLKLLNFQINELAKEYDRFIFINPIAPHMKVTTFLTIMGIHNEHLIGDTLA